MGKTKRRRNIEIYESYWKFTAAFTDIYGVKFNHCLSVIVNYIDEHHEEIALVDHTEKAFKASNLYKNLQEKIVVMMDYKGKDGSLSARKAINMFVKIGFIEPFLGGYHRLVKKYLRASDEQKQILFSKIFYEKSSLASGTTEDNSNLHHVKFFLQTLDYNRSLSNKDLTALMVTDITKYKKGYLTREELDEQYRYAIANNFEERKYNQISHLIAYFRNFVDLQYSREQEKFWFADDPEIADEQIDSTYPRNNIKHRIYKNELKDEASKIYGMPVCFLEKRPYKVLIASHIKPCNVCLKERNEDEAYDPNNGLLLSPTVDSYFDKFDISFSDDGRVLVGKCVEESIKVELLKNRLDDCVLTSARRRFLAYHRAVFEKKMRNEK